MIPVVEKRPRDDRVRTAGPTTCCSHQGYSFGCLYEECSTASTQRDATVTPSTRSIAQVRHPVRLVDPVRVRRAAALRVPALPEVRVARSVRFSYTLVMMCLRCRCCSKAGDYFELAPAVGAVTAEPK